MLRGAGKRDFIKFLNIKTGEINTVHRDGTSCFLRGALLLELADIANQN